MSDETVRLQQEIDQLRVKLGELMLAGGTGYYHSDAAQHNWFNLREIPQEGLDRGVVKLIIKNAHSLDFDHRLNTSSYVNVSLEEEEDEIALMGCV